MLGGGSRLLGRVELLLTYVPTGKGVSEAKVERGTLLGSRAFLDIQIENLFHQTSK